MEDNPKIFSGNANKRLVLDISARLGVPIGKANVTIFSDGETRVEINENVRGADVFIIQSTCSPVNVTLMELLVMIDAMKRASAGRITAVIPYYGYARQDRKVAPRTPITSKLVADLLTSAGADRILAVDLHAAQIQGFFNIPFDHLYATPVLLEYLQSVDGGEIVVVSPDAGGVERARAYAKRVNATLAIIDKRRLSPNISEVMNVIGEVKGKVAVILDDMIDTAGTLTQAVPVLLEKGATKVFGLGTHAVLSGPAIERITESPISGIGVTDTIALRGAAATCKKIQVLSVATLLGEAIRRIHGEDSVSSLFV